MKRTVVMRTLALAVGIALGMVGSQMLNAQQEPVTLQALLKTDLPGIEGKAFLVEQVELAPGVVAGKHYHPGNVFVYVLEGVGILEIEGKPAVTQQAGSMFHAPQASTDLQECQSDRSGQMTAPGKFESKKLCSDKEGNCTMCSGEFSYFCSTLLWRAPRCGLSNCVFPMTPCPP